MRRLNSLAQILTRGAEATYTASRGMKGISTHRKREVGGQKINNDDFKDRETAREKVREINHSEVWGGELHPAIRG